MHEVKSLLSNLLLKDSEGKAITEGSTTYLNFSTFIDSFCSARNRTVLYRGTKSIEEYNADIFDIPTFAKKMFTLGAKSHYFEPHTHALFCVDDHSLELFEFIFEKLNDKLCGNKFNSPGTITAINSFIQNNQDFYEFFSNETNKTGFISLIDKLDDKEKEQAKDYYLSLMHVVGKSLSPNSYMISTSKELKRAEEFIKDGIIIVSWVPSSERHRQIIKFNDVNKTDSMIKRLGLPSYGVSPYSEQKEICVKGGLLPHYIIGYSLKDSFIVNPGLLSQISSAYDLNRIIIEGIGIDQSKFKDVLKTTKYKGGFICIDGYYCDY